jgi:ketosteroid isomerase-like protein
VAVDGRMSEIQRNKASVVALFEHFSMGDLAAARSLCTPDFRWVVPTVSGFQSETLRNLPNILHADERLLDAAMEAFRLTYAGSVDGKIVFSIGEMTGEGDRVAAEGHSRAVNRANGRTYTNRYMFHVFFRDGKINQLREYQDTLHALDVWQLA